MLLDADTAARDRHLDSGGALGQRVRELSDWRPMSERMYKLIVHIDRKEGMDEAAFHDHWENEHVPIVKQVPNLVKYTTSVPVEPEEADFDGIAELYFEEREHVGEAIESETGSEALADLVNFTEADPDQVIVEETVQKDET